MYPSIWRVSHIIPGDKLQENEKNIKIASITDDKKWLRKIAWSNF